MVEVVEHLWDWTIKIVLFFIKDALALTQTLLGPNKSMNVRLTGDVYKV